MALREKTAGERFTFVVKRPFVVIGDEAPEVVRQRASRTVRWTVDLLRKDFFARDPGEIIDIWAFKDAKSYARHAWELFRDRPTTPYGYYSAQNRALVMNIAPGAGTLVHELVHPYMRANFPGCPPWLNEGLASLYERPSEEGGHLVGLVNWRLPARAIRAGRLPDFRILFAMRGGGSATGWCAGTNRPVSLPSWCVCR
jgi:hypothetical protein